MSKRLYSGLLLALAVFGPSATINTKRAVAPVSTTAIADYYASVVTTSPAELRRTLHELIDDHKRFPYTSSATDTWDILEDADQDPSDPNNIIDLYKNASYVKIGGGTGIYNREHSWPKSYGFPNDNSKNYPYTDCHHLFLCNGSYNSSRSNKPYATCDASATEKTTEENHSRGGGVAGTHPGTSNWTTGAHESGSWETWVGRRGDVARALFYLDVRYEGGTHGTTNVEEPDLILTDNRSFIASGKTGNNERVAYMGLLSVLLTWHCEDPVDAFEKRRNEAIAKQQGNRNPFIDHPDWVHTLFGSMCTGAPVVDPTVQPSPVFISEMHYDNKGKDKGEFVEVAGPVGTDLKDWRLVAYNGSSRTVYRSLQLSGIIPGTDGGNGALAFAFKGLQNGAPDGIVLVDASRKIVEFLSYEGTFQGKDGPAEGRVSTDMGQSESGTTPVGHSLQRKKPDEPWTVGPSTRGSL